jgi:class 3 adenylate cyclase
LLRDTFSVADDGRPGATEFEAAGVFDPEAPDALQHLALLEYLVSIGVTLDEIQVTPLPELPALASAATLWPGRELSSMMEVAASSGLELEFLERFWRAVGFPVPDPDEPSVLAGEVEAMSSLRIGIDFFGEEVTIQLARVLGAAAARVADTAVSSFVVNVAPEVVQRDPSGLELARANAAATALLPNLVAGFDVLLRHHVYIARRFGEIEQPGVDIQQRSIGFVDLVESTALSSRLDIADLARALAEFDATATDVVSSMSGRVVKLIGDEVMFVTTEPRQAVAIALTLIDTFAEHEVLPPVRAAVTTGRVVAREGDFSGTVVSCAARAVKLARVSTLLVDSDTQNALSDDVRIRRAGAFSMKGFPERVPLYRVSRSDGND